MARDRDIKTYHMPMVVGRDENLLCTDNGREGLKSVISGWWEERIKSTKFGLREG
jgi:hypothetical protein